MLAKVIKTTICRINTNRKREEEKILVVRDSLDQLPLQKDAKEMKEQHPEKLEAQKKERNRRTEHDSNFPLIAVSNEEITERSTTSRRSAEAKRGERRDSNINKLAPWRRLLRGQRTLHEVGDIVEAEWGREWMVVRRIRG